MPRGGKVFVETSNVAIGADHIADHPDAVPGPTVLLEVTDGGVGIDDETWKKNIFEPFFTTRRKSARVPDSAWPPSTAS